MKKEIESVPCSDDTCEITPEMLDELSNGKGDDEDDVYE